MTMAGTCTTAPTNNDALALLALAAWRFLPETLPQTPLSRSSRNSSAAAPRSRWDRTRARALHPLSPVAFAVRLLGTNAASARATLTLVLYWIPGKAMFALQNSYVREQYGWTSAQYGRYSAIVCAVGIFSTHYGSRLRGVPLPSACGGASQATASDGDDGGDGSGGGDNRLRHVFSDGTLLQLCGLTGAASCVVFSMEPSAPWFYVGGGVYGLSLLLNPTFRAVLARGAPAHEQAGVLGSVGALEILVQMVAPEMLRPAFDSFSAAGWPQGYYAVCGAVFLAGMVLAARWFPCFAPHKSREAQETRRSAGCEV